MKHMKKYILLLFLGCTISLSYGQSIDDLFKTMPDELLPAFSEANKTMLLVDSALSVIPYPLGEIEKLDYSDTFLSLKTSKVGTMQIKILPLINNTKIVALINTVCSKICDSDVRFFTEKWEEIDKESLLPILAPHIFFDKTEMNTPDFKWVVSHIDIYPIQFQFKKGSNDLEVKFDIAKHLSPQDLKKIKPYMNKETIDLSWNKSTFVFK